jgi:peptide/nickel transport system permease protein|tara:strand:- start:1427 stop:2458 length:1032 start_codon:yes stop_codon:yes gene_type:complete
LWGVLTLVFFLFTVLPGDPARMMLDQREDSQQLRTLKQKYGFDKSISTQYFLYLNDLSPLSIHSKNNDAFNYVLSGKYNYRTILEMKSSVLVLKTPYLRESFAKRGKSVTSVITDTFPNTFILAVAAIFIALLLGVFLGVFSAIFKDSILDRITLFLSVFGMSVPSFFSAILFAWIFGFLLADITGLAMTGSLFEIDDYGNGEFMNLKNLILPSVTLGIRPLSVIVQLTRNSLLEVLKMDFMRTAIAKGLSKFIVLFKHGLRNALNPVVTAVSGWFASLLSGAVFVEYIFAWNGLGKEIVDALNMLDLPVVMGAVLFIATIFVLVNFIVDIIYGILDPRIRIT